MFRKAITIFLALISVTAFGAPPVETLRKRALGDLEFLKHTLEVKYAPSLWKKSLGWNLDDAYRTAKLKVFHSTSSVKNYQVILRDFLLSTMDYHVGIEFFSTESASLPFTLRGAHGRYFVVFVDEARTDALEVGDEILAYNGVPIDMEIQLFKKTEIGENVSGTDQGLAELSFTKRIGAEGHLVPRGEVTFLVKNKQGETKEVSLAWNHVEEKIKEITPPAFSISKEVVNQKDALKQFFNKQMVAACYNPKKIPLKGNKFEIGSKSSFIPLLGKKIWKNYDLTFDACIFQIYDEARLPPGKDYIQVGYIRISDFMGDSEEAEKFQELIAFMDYKTDLLVIDEVNNPGGSYFYLCALASMLTESPLPTPKHRITLTQEEIQQALMQLEVLELITTDYEARAIYGYDVGGYLVDYSFVENTKRFCRFIISEWEKGKTLSDPIHLFGVDEIKPHPYVRYTKPIVIAMNELAFSAGDFFPEILKERATLFGARTAGAGGYIMEINFPNLTGISKVRLTGSMALRFDALPLENNGVEPHVQYVVTPEDYQNGFESYKEKLLETVFGAL